MYLEHFKLKTLPFKSAPDTNFYYHAASHEQAVAKILYAAESHLGLGMVIGSPGVGKSMVLDVAASGLDQERFFVVPISLAGETPEGLLYAVLAGLGETELSPQRGELVAPALISRIFEWTEAIRLSSRHTVLLIDEAQLAKERASLDAIRSLLNPPSGTERTLTVILFGLDELGSRVGRFVPLGDRVEVSAELKPLSRDEGLAYILHRMELAGARRGIFTRRAAQKIIETGHYTPGLINRICELSLVTAMGAGMSVVGPDVVDAVIEDLDQSGSGERFSGAARLVAMRPTEGNV